MTIKEIASLSGVSVATVSRVINGLEVVKPEVRERINKVIAETGYIPNTIARGLVKKKSSIIGVMTPRFHGYYMPRIEGIMKKAKENGYTVLLGTGYGRFTGETESLKMLEENRIEGLIYIAAKYTEEKVAELKRIGQKLPVVLMDQKHDDLNFSCVKFDYKNASLKVMEYLISIGHRRIAFIGGPYYDSDSISRLESYQKVLNDNNITVPNSYITAGYYSISSGYEAAGKILTESEELPTAVFAGNDYMAFGAIKRFCETGFKVPDDISVAGIDDIEISGNYNPPLTTMHADQVLAGEKAAEMLFKYISSENSGYEVLSLGMELIERKSVLRLV